jgi:hypothetical protein
MAAGIDVKRANKLCDTQRVLKYLIWQRERSLLRLQLLKKKPNEAISPYFSSVLDLKGVTFTMANSSEFHQLIKYIIEVDSQYAGRIGKMLVINTPYFFHLLWAIFSKWADAGVERKVHICRDFQPLCDLVGGWDMVPSNYLGGKALPVVPLDLCPLVHYNHLEEWKPEEAPPFTPPPPPPPPAQQAVPPIPIPSSTSKQDWIQTYLSIEQDMLQFERNLLFIRSKRWRKPIDAQLEMTCELEKVKRERDSLSRALGFAKNYIEVQNEAWLLKQLEWNQALQRAEQQREELQQLTRKLKATGGLA